MNLLSAAQIREWDDFTIKNEPISSINLMERAARACVKWIVQNLLAKEYYIFCGKGNNGGDGLAIARLLRQAKINVKVFVLESGATGSNDYNTNFKELHHTATTPITLIRNESDFAAIPQDTIIIDALFGTGLNRPLDHLAAALVSHLNNAASTIIAIDVPSGLLCDDSSLGFPVINATHTLTFQCLKLAFLIAENERYIGQVHILDINLHPDFNENIFSKFQLINQPLCQSIFKQRSKFAHKGDFGHALIIAGSYGKMGAAILATRACLRSGSGLVTSHVPKCGLQIMQTSAPEAMCVVDASEKELTGIDYNVALYKAIGIGPGMGTGTTSATVLRHLIDHYHNPIVVDADALNILAGNKSWLSHLPENSILTPHPKEFARLFGDKLNGFQKLTVALENARALKAIIILKGHYTFIATPGGLGYFNITGNPGMATGGSGDVLTGVLAGLLAQGYSAINAAILGVFLHGLAGDKAATKHSMEAMIAGDIVEELGAAFSM